MVKKSPQMLKNSNLSHYEMIRQFVETLKRWGKATYIGFNSIEFDEEFLRSTLFQTLEYPYLTSTNGNTRGDVLSLARAANLYYPDTLKNPVNEKGNDVYKLDQMAPLNGIEHGDAHSAIGDVAATIGFNKTKARIILILVVLFSTSILFCFIKRNKINKEIPTSKI